MLDEISAAALAAVNDACPGGGFKILEEEDLARLLPAGTDTEATLLRLAEEHLIELRYAEGGTYCVRTMPEGRDYAERRLREQTERRILSRAALSSAFWGAFAGGLLAALLTGLVGLLL